MDTTHSSRNNKNPIHRMILFLALFFLVIPGQLQIHGLTIKWTLICIFILFIISILRIIQLNQQSIFEVCFISHILVSNILNYFNII
jgi:hypothetical protein